LAWLTAGEFVMSKRAVDALGVNFLYALNSLSIMPRFAGGGLNVGAVPRLAPASVSGGKVGGRTFTLVFGNEHFSDLSGPDVVLERMERAAVRQQLSSAGRRQSWRK
jgi:hypothetical protein